MDTLLNIIKLNILTSLPQTFIYLLFIFSFLRPLPTRMFKRLAIITLIHSIYTDVAVFYVPLQLHLLNSFLAFAALFFVVFRELGLKRLVFVYIFFILFFLTMDIILVTFAVYVVGFPNREAILTDNLYQILALLYPQLLITLVISWFIRKRDLLSANRLFSIIITGDRRTLAAVLSLIFLQFVLIATLLFVQTTDDPNKSLITAILIYMVIAVSLFAFAVIFRLLIGTRNQAIKVTQELYIDDINNMFTSIRGQRHDFLNHVQVIHTMTQMGKIDQLNSYVADLVVETQEVSKIVHHASPAIAALIQAKTTIAEGKGIAFTYELPSNWNVQESSIKIIDIIKIIGNLVDNAFDESENLSIELRKVHTSIRMEENTIQLCVSNSGRLLEAEDRKKIFLPGYSTKGENHSGLGLAIVLERVRHYNGELEVTSMEGSKGILFRITLPHKESAMVI